MKKKGSLAFLLLLKINFLPYFHILRGQHKDEDEKKRRRRSINNFGLFRCFIGNPLHNYLYGFFHFVGKIVCAVRLHWCTIFTKNYHSNGVDFRMIKTKMMHRFCDELKNSCSHHWRIITHSSSKWGMIERHIVISSWVSISRSEGSFQVYFMSFLLGNYRISATVRFWLFFGSDSLLTLKTLFLNFDIK